MFLVMEFQNQVRACRPELFVSLLLTAADILPPLKSMWPRHFMHRDVVQN